MVKIVFERKDKKEKVSKERVAEPEIMKVYSEKRDVNVGGEPIPPIPPDSELRRKAEELGGSPVGDEVEYFKRKYASVFGLDSVISSTSDVIMLNLLFAVYSELVGLREDLRKNE